MDHILNQITTDCSTVKKKKQREEEENVYEIYKKEKQKTWENKGNKKIGGLTKGYVFTVLAYVHSGWEDSLFHGEHASRRVVAAGQVVDVVVIVDGGVARGLLAQPAGVLAQSKDFTAMGDGLNVVLVCVRRLEQRALEQYGTC